MPEPKSFKIVETEWVGSPNDAVTRMVYITLIGDPVWDELVAVANPGPHYYKAIVKELSDGRDVLERKFLISIHLD